MVFFKRNKKPLLDYRSKRCAYCSTQLPLDATVCTECKQKVGKVDALGRAKKPINWMAYIICVITWAIFIGYLWWAFFQPTP